MHCFCVHHRVPKRYLVTTLVFIGCFCMYSLRIPLGIALVEMTSEKTIVIGDRVEKVSADYNWNSVEKGYILSVFAIGYVCTFVGSPVVVRFGGATTFGVAMALNGLISILSPAFFRIHLYLYLPARTLQGLLMGVGTTGVVDTFAHWSPPELRVRLTSYYFMGCFCGVALGYPLFGSIAHHLGWQATFYTAGVLALVWSTVWLTFVANDPSQDRYITEEERAYLKEKIRHITTDKVTIPWKDILKSPRVWALLNEYFSVCWCASFVMFCIPLYMKDMYDVDIQQIGFLGGLPTACSVITTPLYAYLADYLRTNVFNVPKVHNIFIFFGNAGVLLTLGVIALGTDPFWTVICFCLIRLMASLPDTSYAVLPIDIAGQYSGVIKAMSLSAGAIAHFLNPIIIGYMAPNHTRAEWNLYFLFLTCVSLYGLIMFYLFGSGELQPWAVVVERGKNGAAERVEDVESTVKITR